MKIPKLLFCFLPLKLPFSFWWTVSLMSGIWFAHAWSPFACLLLLIPIIATLPEKIDLKITYPLFFFCLGAYLYTQQTTSKLPAPELKEVIVQGKILDKSYIEGSCWKYRTRIEVEKIKTDLGWINTHFELYVYTYRRIYPWVQDQVECGPITIKEPVEKGFYLYLCRENVAGTSFAEKLPCKTIHRPAASWSNWIFWQRELLQIKLRKKMSPVTFSLFSSLFFGNRDAVKTHMEEYKQSFKLWGIMHHLARSGLHLVIFIFLWSFFLNFIPARFWVKHLTTFILTTLYLLFSWPSISFLRALGSFVFYKLGVIGNYNLHPIHIASSVCFVLLVQSPVNLLFLDFQLSFLLSFGLLWIAHVHHQRRVSEYKSIAQNGLEL